MTNDSTRYPKPLRSLLEMVASAGQEIPSDLTSQDVICVRAIGIPNPFRFAVLTGKFLLFIEMKSGTFKRVLETIDEWHVDPEERKKKYYGKNAPAVAKVIWLDDMESIEWVDLHQNSWIDADTKPTEAVTFKARKVSRSRGRKIVLTAMDGEGFAEITAWVIAATARAQSRKPDMIFKPLPFVHRAPDKSLVTAGAMIVVPFLMVLAGLFIGEVQILIAAVPIGLVGLGVLALVFFNEKRFREDGHAPKTPNRYALGWDEK